MTLSVTHGAFTYPGGRELLRDVNFSVHGGDLLAVLGPNGAGKTTLLRCMMAFLRWTRGSSTLDGTDIHAIAPRTLWQQLAYVPQARHATAAYTVEETVLLGRSSRIGVFSQPGAEDLVVAHRVLDDLGIFALRHMRCTQLSGGELQMALIARALAQQPRVLVLDEPESNLDFKNQLIILQTLSRLVADGMTCIFNTHYPAHALQRANKALLLTHDGDALFGDTTDIVTEANIERAFGVKTAIGAVETDTMQLQSVVPLSLSGAASDGAHAAPPCGLAPGEPATRIAAIAIIADSDGAAEKINALLHACKDAVIGRMGMPYPQRGVHIINVTLDAPEAQVRTLAQQLAALPGVSVKATFAAEALNLK